MKTLCIYSKNNLDGLAAVAILKLSNSYNHLDLLPFENNDKIDILKVDTYDIIIICNVILPHDIMIALKKKILWFSHHKSYIDDSIIKRYDDIKGIRNKMYSTCELMLDNYSIHTSITDTYKCLSTIITYLGLYHSNRYKTFYEKGRISYKEYTEILYFQYYMRSYVRDVDTLIYEITNVLTSKESINNAIQQGKAVYNYEYNRITNAYNQGEKGYINNIPALFITSDIYNFNDFDIDYHKNKIQIIVTLFYTNGYWHINLYNNNGQIDCFEIAKNYEIHEYKNIVGFRIDSIDKLLTNCKHCVA